MLQTNTGWAREWDATDQRWLDEWFDHEFRAYGDTFRETLRPLLIALGKSEPERWSNEGYGEWLSYGLSREQKTLLRGLAARVDRRFDF